MTKTKKRKLNTQQQVMEYLRKLRPRYRIRVPLRSLRASPFLYIVGADIPGNAIRITDAVYLKLLKNGKIKLVEAVSDNYACYKDYAYTNKKRKR